MFLTAGLNPFWHTNELRNWDDRKIFMGGSRSPNCTIVTIDLDIKIQGFYMEKLTGWKALRISLPSAANSSNLPIAADSLICQASRMDWSQCMSLPSLVLGSCTMPISSTAEPFASFTGESLATGRFWGTGRAFPTFPTFSQALNKEAAWEKSGWNADLCVKRWYLCEKLGFVWKANQSGAEASLAASKWEGQGPTMFHQAFRCWDDHYKRGLACL